MFVGSEIGLSTGAMLPSSATYGGLRTMVLSLMTNSPCHSTSARSRDRLGKLAPSPHDTPSETRNSSGSPRSTAPAMPDISNAWFSSRLTTRSRWPSQSFVLDHVEPLGNFTMTRGAMLMASPRDWEIRLHFPPTMIGPPSVFDQPRRRYGYSCETPPNTGSAGMNVGLTSRSSRTVRHDPNSSTRSPRATAAVNPI